MPEAWQTSLHLCPAFNSCPSPQWAVCEAQPALAGFSVAFAQPQPWGALLPLGKSPLPVSCPGPSLPRIPSTPSVNALAQTGINKHSQRIWEQTGTISQLRALLCFLSRFTEFVIPIPLASPVERSLLLINTIVRLDHSVPWQFLFVLFFLQSVESHKFSGNRTKLSHLLFFLTVPTAAGSRRPNLPRHCAPNCLAAQWHGLHQHQVSL